MSHGTTYLNLNEFAERTNDLCAEVNKKWASSVTDALMSILGKLAEDTDKSVEEAKAEALKHLDLMKKTGDEVGDKISHLVADIAIESYNHGFSEGSYDAEQEFVRTYSKLVEEGYLDEDPKMDKFVDILKSVSNKRFNEDHKGEPLMVDPKEFFGFNGK